MPAPVLQHGQLTLQTDSSSCGVCVCYTVDEIASRSLNLRHTPFCVDDFRAWMTYALTQASTTCHVWIKQFLEKHNMGKPGLPNASNNCWFNSVVQCIQSIVSCSSTTKCLQMHSHTGLNNWLKTLLRTFALRMRFFKTFSLQFVRVWAGIPSLSGMSQSFSCSMTSKHSYKVLVLYLSFSLKLTKRVEVAEQIV